MQYKDENTNADELFATYDKNHDKKLNIDGMYQKDAWGLF